MSGLHKHGHRVAHSPLRVIDGRTQELETGRLGSGSRVEARHRSTHGSATVTLYQSHISTLSVSLSKLSGLVAWVVPADLLNARQDPSPWSVLVTFQLNFVWMISGFSCQSSIPTHI